MKSVFEHVSTQKDEVGKVIWSRDRSVKGTVTAISHRRCSLCGYAPCYIVKWEDGKFIRYLFKNGKCIIEEGSPIFPSDLQYVVIKRIYDDYHNAGIEVCGVYTREVDAQNRLIDEASKAIQFLNENADKYPARFRLFGNENYWTAAEKKIGTTRNIIDISIYKANSLPLKNDNKEIQK